MADNRELAPKREDGPPVTLFEAIEQNDERAIADVLRQIVMVARERGWNAEDVIRMLRKKDIDPGDNLKTWIRYQFAALDAAAGKDSGDS